MGSRNSPFGVNRELEKLIVEYFYPSKVGKIFSSLLCTISKKYRAAIEQLAFGLVTRDEPEMYELFTEQSRLEESAIKSLIEKSRPYRKEWQQQNPESSKGLREPVLLGAVICNHGYSMEDIYEIVKNGDIFLVKEECECSALYYKELKKLENLGLNEQFRKCLEENK